MTDYHRAWAGDDAVCATDRVDGVTGDAPFARCRRRNATVRGRRSCSHHFEIGRRGIATVTGVVPGEPRPDARRLGRGLTPRVSRPESVPVPELQDISQREFLDLVKGTGLRTPSHDDVFNICAE